MYSYEKAYQKLIENNGFLDEDGFVIENRSIPEENYLYRLDPRSKLQSSNTLKNISFQKKDSIMELIRGLLITDQKDITKHSVVINRYEVNEAVHVYAYTPLYASSTMPCILYIHGGSFIGGSATYVHEQCKAMSEKCEAVIINVEYRLAPEFPFPCALMDCYDALHWCKENPMHLPYDPHKIAVCGDSAGGGLSASLVLLERMRKEASIGYVALLYPCVLLKENAEYPWSGKAYTAHKDHIDIVESILSLRASMLVIEALYLKEKGKPDDPLVSPLCAKDLSNFPPTLVVSAEYDYLRVQGEMFAKKLASQQVDVRCIRYDGMEHAFMDRMGTYPQAERVIDDIAQGLNKVFKKEG